MAEATVCQGQMRERGAASGYVQGLRFQHAKRTFLVRSLPVWHKAYSPAGVRLPPVVQYPNTICWLVTE